MVRNIKGNTELGRVNENTSVFQGDDETIKVTVKNEKQETVDISSASTIEYKIAEEGSSALSKSLGSGISITDGANGVFEINISSSDTSSISGKYDHEAEIDLNGKSTLFQGTIRIRGTII